jgi:outer membrane lipoprotein-sorting protein
MLSGRVPEFEHHSSEIKEAGTSNGYVLVLHKKWWMGSQKIYLAADRQEIEKIETFNGSDLTYRVEYKGMQSIDSYEIPKRLVVTNREGNRFQIDIDRFWANAAVAPDLFTLRPPNRK